MADEETVSHLQKSHNSLSPRLGVVTLFGYGTSVPVSSVDTWSSRRNRTRPPSCQISSRRSWTQAISRHRF